MSENAPAKRPRKLLRWLIGIAVVAVLALAGLVFTAGKIANSYLTPDYIASVIEAENNCRVEIASTDISLFSSPARVEIKGLKIAPRDEHADAGTKLADRPPVAGTGTFQANSVVLEANIFDLIKKRISIKHLTLSGVFVGELLIEEEGGPRLSKNGPKLDELFDPPVTVAGTANPEYEEKKQRREAAKARRELTKEERTESPETSFTITELPLPATMQALNIKDAQINAKIRRNKTRITLSDIQLKLSDIDLDPGDLSNHNRAKVSLSGHLDIEDRDRTVKYADLDLRSEGEVTPFDPVTGYINPDLTYKITVLKDSKLDSIPSLAKLAGKIKKLNEIGLKLDVLADSVTLDEDTAVTLGYRDSTLRLPEPALIGFNGHLLTVNEGAWLHTGSNRHEATADVLLSVAASDNALGNARDFLTEQLPVDRALVLKYTNKLLEPVTKEGRVWVPFTSTGDLNDPKVRPDVDIKSAAETLALEALGDILDKTQKDAGK